MSAFELMLRDQKLPELSYLQSPIEIQVERSFTRAYHAPRHAPHTIWFYRKNLRNNPVLIRREASRRCWLSFETLSGKIQRFEVFQIFVRSEWMRNAICDTLYARKTSLKRCARDSVNLARVVLPIERVIEAYKNMTFR